MSAQRLSPTRVGIYLLLILFALLFLIPVYVLLTYNLLPFGIPIAMLGIAFSLLPAVMWPAVAYIVEEKRLGTAYAVMTLIQQIGVAGMNWLIGRANDRMRRRRSRSGTSPPLRRQRIRHAELGMRNSRPCPL